MDRIRKIILTVLATFLLLPTVSRPIKVVANENNKPSDTLRVATHNIEYANKNTAEKISAHYVEHDIDIVGTQEVDMFNGRNNYNTIETLKSNKLPHVHFAKGRDYSGGDFGIGFVSQHKFLEKSSEPIEHPSGSPATKTMQRAVIEFEGKKIALYNVHLSWESLGLRERQLAQLKERLNNDPTEYIILVGDFNTDQHLREYTMFYDQFDMANGGEFGWFDTYLDNDDPTMRHKRIDNILVSKNMSIENVYLDHVRLADHAMLYADITFKAGSIPAPSNNLLLGKNLSYSHAKDSGLEEYDIYKITDMKADAFISEKTADEQTITIDLHGAYDVDNFAIDWEVAPDSYKVNSYLLSESKEIYNKESEAKGVATIPINNTVTKLEIKINNPADKTFAINSISAKGSQKYNIEGNNIVPNHDFSSIVPEPKEQPPGYEEARWDTDMWTNEEKPEHWIYQRYPKTTRADMYNAEVLKSDRDGSDENMVRITKKNTASNTNGFFKQMFNQANPNTAYRIGFWYKNEDITSDSLSLSISELNANNDEIRNPVIDGFITKSNDDWQYFEYIWTTTEKTEKYNLTFRLDGTAGTYYLENFTIKEVAPSTLSFETARHTLEDYMIESGESKQLITDYYPLTPSEAGINVTWESSDNDIATVNSNGVVTGRSEGEVYITQRNNVTDRYHSAILVEVKSPEKENILENWDFAIEEDIPTNSKWFSDNTWHDAELWLTDKKPAVWMFQKWQPSAPTAEFKAYHHENNGNRYVEIDVSNKPANSQAFFKQMNVPVEQNTVYELVADIKKVETKGRLLMRAQNGSTFENYFSGTDDDFVKHSLIFNSGNKDSYNIILGYMGDSSGIFEIDNVILREYDGLPREINLNEDDIRLLINDVYQIEAEVLPSAATNKNLVYTSSNEDVVTVDNGGTLTALKPGTTTIAICAEAKSDVCATQTIKVEASDIVPSDAVIHVEDTLTVDSKRLLDFSLVPELALSPNEVVWSVDGDAAVINEFGFLEATKTGNATITLTLKYDEETVEVSKTVSVVKSTTNQDYIKIREQWVENLIGNSELWSSGHEEIGKYIEDLDALSLEYYDTLHKYNDRLNDSSLTLWDNYADETYAAHMTTQFRKLQVLTRAFMTENTELYQDKAVFNEIVAGFDYMLDVRKFGDKGSYSGNWWDYQIGSSQVFSDALLLLKDYLNDDQIDKFANAIKRYNWDPSKQISGAYPGGFNATGANRGDIGLSVLAVGVLLEDSSMLDLIVEKIPSIWKYVTSGDGFYRDGSFIQHGNIAYSGSYGVEVLRSISGLIGLTEGTKWKLSSAEDFDNLNDIVVDTYLPIVHQGQLMAAFMGRSISRAPGLNKYAPAFSGGSELAANLMVLLPGLDEDVQEKIKEHVKLWLESAKPYYDYIENSRDFEMLANLVALSEDETVVAKVDKQMHVYALMNRGLYQADKFNAALSLTSYRIANYEGGVGAGSENKKGWHTGDGMLYVYNNDLNMFGESYWPTLDFYRLPGITVDTRPLGDNVAQGKTSSGQRWVGGVGDGQYGAMGLNLDKSKQISDIDLTAKKSYFFIDDQIILLGSDVNGTSPNSIETIIENRILNEKAPNLVTKNGEVIEGFEGDVTKDDYFHLEGIDQDASFGYVFLNDNNVTAKKTTNTGSYADINGTFVTHDEYTSDYFLLNVNHGQQVNDGQYGYVILPGKTAEETAQYVKASNIKVLQQDSTAHIVYDEKNNTLMLNYFDTSKPLSLTDDVLNKFGIEDLEISDGTGISMMIRINEEGEIVYTVSNPNFDGMDTTIRTTMPNAKISKNGLLSEEVNELADKQFELVFDSNGKAGGSFDFRFTLENNVTVKYVDETGKELAPDVVLSGVAFDDYTTEALDIDNYDLINTPNNATGTFTSHEQTVVYVYRKINTDVLVALIEKVEAMELKGYTSESVTNLENNLAAAIEELENPKSQEAVDSAREALAHALENLVSIDTKALEDLINEVEAKDLKGYTDESVAALEAQLKAAIKALEDLESQEAIDEAHKNLQAALENLVEITEDDNDEDVDQDIDEDKDEETDLPPTGINGNTAFFVSLLFVSLLFIVVNKKTIKRKFK